MIVRFAPAASNEVYAIAQHYAAIDRKLGYRILDNLADISALLIAHPRLGVPVSNDCRRVNMLQFSYAVYYRIDEVEKVIWIVSVTHQRRRPGSWQHRVQEEPARYATAA